MSPVRALAVGAAVGLALSAVLLAAIVVVDLRADLERERHEADDLAAQVDELEAAVGENQATILSLETQIEVLTTRLEEALPRLRQGAAGRACEAAIAAGPTLPADWAATCVAESDDDALLGVALPERNLGGGQWGGTIVIYFAEHLDFGPVGSPGFRAELNDTVAHEVHHAWCMRSGGDASHDGELDQIPVCTVAVPIGPPVGEWGGADG